MRSPLSGFRVLLGVLLILAGMAPAALADAPWSEPQTVASGVESHVRPGGATVEYDGDVWAALGVGPLNNPVSFVQRKGDTGAWSDLNAGKIPWLDTNVKQSPPQVALGPGGRFYATFQTYNANPCDRVYVATREPSNGSVWTDTKWFGQCNGDPPDLAVDWRGRGVLVWESGGRIMASIKPGSWYESFVWQPEIALSPEGCSAADPTVGAAGSDGSFYVVWRQWGCAAASGASELWGTRLTDDSFVEPAKPLETTNGSKVSSDAVQPELVSDPWSYGAYLTFIAKLSNGSTEVRFATRARNSTIWSGAQTVATSTAGKLQDPSLALSGSRVFVSWLDTDAGVARVAVKDPSATDFADATTVGPATSSGSLLALPNGGAGLLYSALDPAIGASTVKYSAAPPAKPAAPSPGQLLGAHSLLGDTPFDAIPWVTRNATLKIKTTVSDPTGDGVYLEIQRRAGSGSWQDWYIVDGTYWGPGEHTAVMESLPAGSYEYRLRTLSNSTASDWVESPSQRFVVIAEDRVEDVDPRVEYEAPLGSTGWGTQNAQGMPSGENYHYTNTPGAKVTFRFNGTSVRWIAQNGLDKGIVEVFLDGKSQGLVDLYKPTSAKRVYQQAVYTKTGLPNGGHTLTIVGTGKKNVAAKAAWWDVDAFDVPVDTTPPELKNVKATPATFSPDGDGVAETSVVSFDSAEWTRLTVRITRNGATIKTLADGQLVLGTFRGAWDGTTDAGTVAGDGQYQAVIEGADLSGKPVRGVLSVPLVKDGSPAPPDTTPPGRVTGLTATPGDGTVALKWDLPSDPDVVGVRVLVRGDSFPTDPLKDPRILDKRATTHTHAGLTNGSRYFYGVVAYDSSGNFGEVVTVDATPAPPARTPTGVVPSVTQTAGGQGQPEAAAPAAPEPPKPPSDPCAALAGRAKAACTAQATYTAAVAKCGTRKGGAKAACVATAKANKAYALAAASCAAKSGKAKASCLSKATASRKAALRTAGCLALTGKAKARCLVKARRR